MTACAHGSGARGMIGERGHELSGCTTPEGVCGVTFAIATRVRD
jgi:hypothetical protein